MRPQSAFSAMELYETSPRYLAYVAEREKRRQSAFSAAAQYKRSPRYLAYVAERDRRAAEKLKQWDAQRSSSVFDTSPITWNRARVMKTNNEQHSTMEGSIQKKLKKSCAATSKDYDSRARKDDEYLTQSKMVTAMNEANTKIPVSLSDQGAPRVSQVAAVQSINRNSGQVYRLNPRADARARRNEAVHVGQDAQNPSPVFSAAAHNTNTVPDHYPPNIAHNNAAANVKGISSRNDSHEKFGGPQGVLHNCNSMSDVSNTQDQDGFVAEACVSEKKLSGGLKQSTDNLKLDIEGQRSFDASASTPVMRKKPADTHEGFNVYRVKLLIEPTAEEFHVTDSIAAAFESMCSMPRKMLICVTEVIAKTYPSLYVLFRRCELIGIESTNVDFITPQLPTGIGDYVQLRYRYCAPRRYSTIIL